MPGQPGHNTRPYARSPPSFQGMDAGMTSQLNVDFFRELHGVIDVLGLFFDIISIGHWK